MKNARWCVAAAALIVGGFLEPMQADAATLSYANNWNYIAPTGVTLSGSNYFASTTDLANTGRATLAGTVWSGGTSGAFGSSPAQLNNGLYAPSELSGGVPNGSVNAQGTDTTLLATPNSTYTINFTSGMDISSLIVYSAMTGTTRAKQNWSLEYSLVGSGSYTSAGVTIAQNTNGNRQGAWYNAVTLTSGSNEFRNVGSLRFTFLTPVYNSATDGANSTFLDTGYREIDVFGTAVGWIWDNSAANGIWSGSSANWTNGGSSQGWTNGTAAVFGVAGAGAITVSGSNTVSGLTVSANGYSFTGGQITLGQASTAIEVNNSTSIASVIGGANGLVKTGTATLTLSGSNSYSGATTVNAGQISLGNANALGDSAGTLAVNAGTLDLGGNSLTKAALSGSVSGIITSTSSATLTVNQSTSATYGGRISGAVGLTKTGVGGLTLSGSNDYTGTTAVSGGGILAVTNAFALGATGTGSGSVISGTGTALTLQGNINVGESITLLANNGDNINMLRSLSGSNTLSAPVTLSGPSRAGIRATTGDFTVSGGISRDANQNLLLANDGSGLLTVSANPVAIGSGVLEINGPGVTVLNVAGSTMGTLNVRWTGNLRTDVANAWGPTTLLVVGSEGMTSGTNRLDLNGNSQTVGRLSGDAAGTKVNIITSASAATLTVNQGVASTYSGLLSGALSLTKTGIGTLTISGSNTNTGAIDVNDGTLAFDRPAAIDTTSGIGIAAGGILDYTGVSGTLSRNVSVSTSGTGTIRNSGGQTLTLSGTLTKDGRVLRLTGGAFNVTGQIVGASANSDLLVDGTSTVTLSSVGTYNGPTFVNQASTLIVGVNNAIPSNSLVTLGNATTRGTLDLGTYTDAIGGLVFSGSGGTVKMAANQTAGVQLSSTSALALGSNAALDLTGMQTGAGRYQLISYTSNSGTFGSVSGLASGYQLVYGATQLDAQQRAILGTVSTTNPAAIITGGSAAFTYSVANANASGGASLVVTGTGLSNVIGTSSGTAVGGGSTGSLAGLVFTGTSIGANQQGTFTVNALDAFGTTTSTGTVAVTVLDHAASSLSSGPTALLSTVLNLGTWDYANNTWTSGTSSAVFSIYNLASSAGASLTADLSLVSVSGTANGFSTNLGSYTDIAGGQSGQYSVFVNPGSFLTSGTQSWTFTIGMSDKTGMSGATASNTLSVTANVVVVPEPGAIALAGIGIVAAAYTLRRRT